MKGTAYSTAVGRLERRFCYCCCCSRAVNAVTLQVQGLTSSDIGRASEGAVPSWCASDHLRSPSHASGSPPADMMVTTAAVRVTLSETCSLVLLTEAVSEQAGCWDVKGWLGFVLLYVIPGYRLTVKNTFAMSEVGSVSETKKWRSSGEHRAGRRCSRRQPLAQAMFSNMVTGFQCLGKAFLKGHTKYKMRRNFAASKTHRSSWLVAGDNTTTRHHALCSRPGPRR